MPRKTYLETFDGDAGGWFGWLGGGGPILRLGQWNGAVVTRSPWGVDFNHGPPGAGYLHLLMCFITAPADKANFDWTLPYGGVNRFVRDGYSRDFTNVRMTFRVRGNLEKRGAELMLLIQTDVGPVRTNWVLDKQPIAVNKEWTDTTLTLAPDDKQWTCLGTRGPGADCDHYGFAPIADALRDVNVNMILGLFPLNMVPMQPQKEGDLHRLRAGRDYSVDRTALPAGDVWLDTVKFEYPE